MKVRDDMYSDSDDDQHDAYLERMKQEGKIREEANDTDDSEAGSGEWRLTQPIPVREAMYMIVKIEMLTCSLTSQMNHLTLEMKMMMLQKSMWFWIKSLFP